MKVKNILVPIDFSDCARNALKSAIALAKKSDAKIFMVNAVHVHSPHPDMSGGIIEAIVSDYEDQVKESFEELESQLIELQEVPHQADRFVAYLTDAIYTECSEKAIDLIVMGTRESHNEIDHLFGTKATEIIGSSKVPVLVVPETSKGLNIEKIGFACDYKKDIYMEDFDALLWLTQLYDAELLVFNVTEDPDKLTIEDQAVIEKLGKALSSVKKSIRTVPSKSIVGGIIDFTHTHQLDVLAMMPREHSIFEKIFRKSVTKTVAIDVDVPLLTFKES